MSWLKYANCPVLYAFWLFIVENFLCIALFCRFAKLMTLASDIASGVFFTVVVEAVSADGVVPGTITPGN